MNVAKNQLLHADVIIHANFTAANEPWFLLLDCLQL